jgi:hypothetical protein
MYIVEPQEYWNHGLKSRNGHNRCRGYMLFFPMHVEDLQWRIPPFQASYEMLKGFFVLEIILNQEMSDNLGRETRMIRGRSPKVHSVLRLTHPSLHIRESSLFASCCVSRLVIFGGQHNIKNKPIELLILVLFDICYMFRMPILADRGCRVVSATNPHGR